MSRRIPILCSPIALAAVGLLLGACGNNGSGAQDGTGKARASSPTGSTQPGESPTTAGAVALPGGVLALPATPDGQEPAPLAAGRYRVQLNHSVTFDVDLAQGTTSNSDGLYLQSSPNILKVELAGKDYGVPGGPCHSQGIEPAGPAVQDLVRAIGKEPGYRVSHVEPVRIDGAKGAHLQIAIPRGYNAASCTDGQVALPGSPDTSNTMPPGYVADWWVLDVHGHRVVAQEFCDGCTAGQRARVARQVQGLTFRATS